MKQTFQESFEVAVGSSDFHIITQKDKWDAYVPISYATAFYKYLISRLIYAWVKNKNVWKGKKVVDKEELKREVRWFNFIFR